MNEQILPKEHSTFEKFLIVLITISFVSYCIFRNTPIKMVCNIGLYSSVLLNMMSKAIRVFNWISVKTKLLWWLSIALTAVGGGLFIYTGQTIWSIALVVAIVFFTINNTSVYKKLVAQKETMVIV